MANVLSGGRDSIMKDGNCVVRPRKKSTVHIHSFLRELHANDFHKVPVPISISQTNEVLSFVDGEVFNYPLPKEFYTKEMIVSSAKLLREFHNAGKSYLDKINGKEDWMLPITDPIEVMCHGDFAPYNVTVIHGKASGMIDFDTLHPGSIIEDIAYAIYRWVPFFHNENYLVLSTKIDRTKLFLDEYGISDSKRNHLVDQMISRINNLIQYMEEQASLGEKNFQKNITDGHLNQYVNDIVYLQNNQKQILKGITTK